MYKLNYYYGYNAETKEKEVLGVEYIIKTNHGFISQEFYWGIALSLDDALVLNNMALLGITNVELFKARYEKFNASGVIYFPTTKKFYFLEKGDIVFRTKEELFATIHTLEANKGEAVESEYYKELDPEDPLLELNDLPQDMTKRRVSLR